MKITPIVFWLLALGAVAGIVFLIQRLLPSGGGGGNPLGYTPVMVPMQGGGFAPALQQAAPAQQQAAPAQQAAPVNDTSAATFDFTYLYDSTAWSGGSAVTSGVNAGKRGDIFNANSDFMDLTVVAPAAGTYSVALFNGTLDRANAMQVSVNSGTNVQLPLALNQVSATANVALNAGTNVLRFSKNVANNMIFQLTKVQVKRV